MLKFSINERALEIERKADVLLNIGNVIPGMVPSKIFEYMSTCKPIITTFRNENDTSLEYLKKYDSCLAIDEQNSSIKDNANKLTCYLANINNLTVDREKVQRTFANNTPKAFVDEIDRLLQCEGKYE